VTGGETAVFWLLAPLAVLGALGMVFSRKAVRSALWLALTMIVLAVFFGVQGALFLGVVQVVVYTGAVMMLFLFVLMLVGVDASDSLVETIRGHRLASLLAFLAFGLVLVGGISRVTFDEPAGLTAANSRGNVEGVAELVFTRYVWAFEVTSALLITAALGAMVLAHRERAEPRPSQRELAVRRFRGPRPSPLPPPGVYARHNAVDTPALLPDGTPAEESVSAALKSRGEVHERRPAEVAEPAQISHAVEVAEGRARDA
jgi:NADH-quinone oxidoreductase subunit J